MCSFGYSTPDNQHTWHLAPSYLTLSRHIPGTRRGPTLPPLLTQDWNNYKNKDDAKGTDGIVVPLLPFGLKEFDEGERFDLRSPYADMGWVDPEETDMWSGLKKIGSKVGMLVWRC